MSSRAAGRDGARDRIEVDGTADGCLAGLLRTVRVQVYGPVSCELSASMGRTQQDPVTRWSAPLVHGLPELVVSSAPRSRCPAAGTAGDRTTEITEPRRADSEPIVVCAWLGTAQEFLRRDVVDELRLPVFPVLLGAGRRPLDGVPARRLRLVVAHPFPKSGVVRRTYRRQ